MVWKEGSDNCFRASPCPPSLTLLRHLPSVLTSQPLIAHLVGTFRVVPHSSCLYCGSICVTEFGRRGPDFAAVLFQMLNDFAEAVFRCLQASSAAFQRSACGIRGVRVLCWFFRHRFGSCLTCRPTSDAFPTTPAGP